MKTGNKMFEHFPHICMSVAPIMAIPFHVLWVFNFSFLPVELPKEWAVKNTQMGAIANGDHVLRAFCSHLPALLVQTHRVFFDNFIPILRSKKNRWLSIHRKPQKYSNKVKQLLPIFKENMYRIFNYILVISLIAWNIWKRNVLNEIQISFKIWNCHMTERKWYTLYSKPNQSNHLPFQWASQLRLPDDSGNFLHKSAKKFHRYETQFWFCSSKILLM